MEEEELKKAEREVCFNCKHTKRWHKKGCCSQPTCMCNCFIESGLTYTTDIFRAFQTGQLASQEKCLKMIEEWNNQEFESEEYGRFKVHKIGKKDMEDLQQKIKEMKG